MKKKTAITRGDYGQIMSKDIPTATQKKLNNLLKGVENAAKIDEHGGWEFGAEFDKKGRGYAINYDWYAYGLDLHDRRFLAVIQVRMWQKRTKNGFPNVRKSYFLIGRNEDKTFFAHPVSANVIHAAIRLGKDVIKAVQSWMFGADYTQVARQGDICLIPVSRPSGVLLEATDVTLQESHRLQAESLRLNGDYYALNPVLTHLPNTHPMRAAQGWHKVVVSKRGRVWSFAKPTID